MPIEFQVSASRLLAGFLNRLRSMPICIPDEFALDVGDCVGQTLIDQITFPNAGTLRRAPDSTPVEIHLQGGQSSAIDINRLQIAQPIEARMVQRADLASSNTAATDPCLVAQAELIFDLAVQAEGVDVQLCTSLAGVEAGAALPPELVAAVQARAATELPATCTPFDLGPLGQLTGGQPSIANAGVSSDGAFAVLAIRLEIGAPASGASWTSFFAGSVSNHLFGNDWSVFVHKDIVLPVIEDNVSSAIDDYNADHWYDYNVFWGPNATWSNPNGNARVTIKLDGELEQACVCFLFPQDIEMEFHSIVDLSLQQNNQITSTIHVDTISHDDFSIGCCAQTNMLAWAVLGPHYLEDQPAEEFWGGFLLGWGFLPAVFFGSLVAAGDVASKLPPPSLPGAQCTKSDDDDVGTTCTQAVDLGENPLVGDLTLSGLRGLDNGPLLTGSVDPPATIEAAEIDVSSTPFDRVWKDPCDPEAELVVRAHIGVTDISETAILAPIGLCELTVIDDPPAGSTAASQFTPYMTVTNFLSVYLSIDFEVPDSALTEEYLADPYDLRVLVKTSAGVRLVTIAAIQKLTDAEKADLDAKLTNIKVTKCKKWMEWWNDKIFLPFWLPDPPFEGIEVEHLWQMFVSELHPGDSIGLRDSAGKSLGIAHSTEGVAQLSALVTPAASNEIAIEGKQVGAQAVEVAPARSASRAAGTRRSGNRARLEVKQVLLARASMVRLRRACLHLALGRLESSPLLICTTDAGVRVYDLRYPTLPRLSKVSPLSGARGALAWRGDLLTWGEHGLSKLATAEPRVPTAVELASARHIDQVVGARDHLYALGGEAVHIYDRALHEVHALSVPGAMHLAVTGRTLLVANPRGIASFCLDDPVRPAEEGFHTMASIRALVRPILPNPTGTIFAQRAEGGGMLLYFPRGRRPVQTAEFEADPWFVDVVAAGPNLARLDASRHFISNFVATSSTTLPAEERLEVRTSRAEI